MIDLNKFTKSTEAIVPVIRGEFQYNRKKYTVENVVDGWYKVSLKGNDATIIEPVMAELEDMFLYKVLKGYTYHNNFIPYNFDVGKRHAGIDLMANLRLNSAQSFASVEVILWEDKNLYYYKPNYMDIRIHEIKSIYDNLNKVKITNVKGITPELKTLFLFHDLERVRIKQEMEQLERAEKLEEFNQTLRGRLMLAFARVGAKIIDYTVSGSRITVDWKLEATGNTFNSVIEAETFRIIEAGYCMSGSDRDHSVHSMVKLAEVYEEDNLIYKTRSVE